MSFSLLFSLVVPHALDSSCLFILFIFHRQNSSCSCYAVDLNDTTQSHNHSDFPNRQRIHIALHWKGIRSIISQVQNIIGSFDLVPHVLRSCVGSFRPLGRVQQCFFVFYLCPANIFTSPNTKDINIKFIIINKYLLLNILYPLF